MTAYYTCSLLAAFLIMDGASVAARILQDAVEVGDFVWSLGCWTDEIGNRVLSGAFLKADPEMTTEKCATECIGSTYFGTEYAEECFCGSSIDNPAVHGVSTDCDMPCSGDSSQLCGGRYAINVFKYTNYRSLGCFADDAPGRVLSAATFQVPDMTTDCFCGSDMDVADALGVSSDCSSACAGAPSEVCGGTSLINVYRVASASSAPV